MLKNFEIGRKKALNIIYLKTLYLIVQVKIMLMKCLSGKIKNFKHIIPFLMTLLFLASPSIFWAQEPQWPWFFKGENFQITNNLEDNHLPSVTYGNSFISFYLAVWSKKTPSGFDIYGARINRNGEVLEGGDGIPICTAKNDQMFPSVLWDGENFFVVWQDMRSGKRWDIYGARVSLDGQVLDPDGIPIAIGKSSYDQVGPVVSFDGENYLVVWQGKRSSKTWNIYFRRVSKSLEILDEKPVALSPSLKDQASPAVAFDGENYLIVWQDKRGGKFWDIYGARVTPSGEVLDEKGFQITYSSDSGWDRWKPVLSWNGNYYLVIWMASIEMDQWFLYSKKVGPKGEILDLVDYLIQRDGSNKAFPAILWDGSEHLLVWEEEPEGDSKIFGAYFIPDYKPLPIGDTLQISTPQVTDASFPVLACSEDGILVVWQAKASDGNWQIYAQQLSKPNIK
jgi:hypothetical protein